MREFSMHKNSMMVRMGQGTRDLSVREWTCPECGANHDRDVNAAANILVEAKRIMCKSQ